MKGYFCYLALAALCCIGCTPLVTAAKAIESTGRLRTTNDDSQSLKKVATKGLRAKRSSEHVNEITDEDRHLKGKRRPSGERARYRNPKTSTDYNQMNKIKRSSYGKGKGASKQSKGSKSSKSKGKGKGASKQSKGSKSKSSKGKGKGKDTSFESRLSDAPTQGPGSTDEEISPNPNGSEPSPAPTPAPTVDQGDGAPTIGMTDTLDDGPSDEVDIFGSIQNGELMRVDGMSMPTNPPTKVPVSTILFEGVWRFF
jgi:hypothetical protein